MRLHRRVTIAVFISAIATMGNPVSFHGQSASRALQPVQDAAAQKSDAKPINVWRGLIPLISTKSEVERLYRKPHVMIGSRSAYEFDKEKVLFTYAVGNCDPQDSNWNVPAGTILEIEIIQQGIVSVNDLGFDLRKFIDERWEHPELVVYKNIDEGVVIRTKTIKIPNAVMSIKFSGSRRHFELACKSSEAVKP